MWVKICANTNLEDARLAVELGADAVGFVFAESKRQVTAEQVAEITANLPERVSKVGVFTTTNAGEILDTSIAAGLDCVQLHTDYDEDLVLSINRGSGGMLHMLQVVDVSDDSDLQELRETLGKALRHPYVVAVLLDASHGGASGGTGQKFDWARVAAMVREVQRETDGQVIIAGGLNAENVGEAIAAFEPWGVDVASGVEALPGKKDAAKVRAFLRNARR